VVTHPTTNLPAHGLSTAERTGSPVVHVLWSIAERNCCCLQSILAAEIYAMSPDRGLNHRQALEYPTTRTTTISKAILQHSKILGSSPQQLEVYKGEMRQLIQKRRSFFVTTSIQPASMPRMYQRPVAPKALRDVPVEHVTLARNLWVLVTKRLFAGFNGAPQDQASLHMGLNLLS
jgi:hypothetical protein